MIVHQVEDVLEGSLEQHAEEARQEQQRWLSAAQEKVSWCSEISGDRYSIEAKLATIEELVGNVDDGEQKTKIVAEKAQLVKAAKGPALKQAAATVQQEQELTGQEDWVTFIHSLQTAK